MSSNHGIHYQRLEFSLFLCPFFCCLHLSAVKCFELGRFGRCSTRKGLVSDGKQGWLIKPALGQSNFFLGSHLETHLSETQISSLKQFFKTSSIVVIVVIAIVGQAFRGFRDSEVFVVFLGGGS